MTLKELIPFAHALFPNEAREWFTHLDLKASTCEVCGSLRVDNEDAWCTTCDRERVVAKFSELVAEEERRRRIAEEISLQRQRERYEYAQWVRKQMQQEEEARLRREAREKMARDAQTKKERRSKQLEARRKRAGRKLDQKVE